MAYTSDECVWIAFEYDQNSNMYWFPLNGLCYDHPSDSPYPHKTIPHPHLIGFDTEAFFMPKQHILALFKQRWSHDAVCVFHYSEAKQCYGWPVVYNDGHTMIKKVDPITRVDFQRNKRD